MLEELNPIVIEVMINYKKPCNIEEVVEICGFEKIDVTRSLNMISELGLAYKVKDELTGEVTYQLIKELKGIHVAKAAQVGLDLGAFEFFFKIDKKEKQLALELATQAEKIKNLDVTKRKPLLQKRTYFIQGKTDDNYENLMVLFEASNATLYEYLETLAEKDSYLKLLMDMHTQTDLALRDYSGTLK